MRFHRYHVPDTIVFITQVVEGRAPVFMNDDATALLLENLRLSKRLHPFTMLAYVFLPDHFHVMLKPASGVTFSDIMHSLKPNFTKAYKRKMGIEGHMHFWQKRFWDHLIRGDDDFSRHLDYIHFNPVKHGWTQNPENWPYSSFNHWKARGFYEDGWGSIEPQCLHGWDVRE